MFEIIEKTMTSKQTSSHVTARENTTITAPVLRMCDYQGISTGAIQSAVLDFGGFLSQHIPAVGDTLHAYAMPQGKFVSTGVFAQQLLIQAIIMQSKRVHIDLSEEMPLWINGAPTTRTERETMAKQLGHNTWRQFCMYYTKHHGYGYVDGFLVSWAQV